MSEYEHAVFVSYAWGAEREDIVNEIDETLQLRGIRIVRDKRALGYKGSIKEFMERIGQGNCVIVVISDKYLRSPNCMFELVEISENKQFHDRVFPIVLSDANIYDPLKRIEYVKYWEAKRAELARAMKKLDPANLQGLRDDMDQYDRIRDKISGITSILKDMNTLTPEMHRDSEFSNLYDAIVRQMDESTAGATAESDLLAKKAEEEQLAQAKAETELAAKEEADHLAVKKAEEERLAQQKADEERLAQAKVEANRKAREEADRLAVQKAEAERLAQQKTEEERLAQVKIEADRKAKEEADRLAAQKAEAERVVKQKATPVEAMPAEMKAGPVSAATTQKKPVSMGLMIGIAAVVVIVIAGIGFSVLSNIGTTTDTETPFVSDPATEAPPVASPATEVPVLANQVTGTLAVGIVLPTNDEPRWVQDETRFKEAFTNAGYDVEVLFSQGDTAKEKENVESLIAKGVKVIIITPQDGSAAAAAAEEAHAAGIQVISYDRLIHDTDAVDYYITFDYTAIGAAQAQYLVDHASGTGNPLYLYAGSSSDNSAFLFFEGAWNVLQPKIADGTFVIKNSSEADRLQSKATLSYDEEALIFDQITTNWDPTTAKELAESNLTAASAADKGNVFILAPADFVARAIADAFAADNDVSSYWVTGQDAEEASVQYIIDGKQSMTVLKDFRILASDAVSAAIAYLEGNSPPQTNTYYNGKIDVPSKPSELISIDSSNVKAMLIDSGYYPASDFTGLP